MKPPRVPGQLRLPPPVPPPKKRQSQRPVRDSQRPTERPPASVVASRPQRLMMLTAALADLPDDAKENLLEVLPALEPILVGSKKDARRRFAAVVAGVAPVVMSPVPGSDRRALALLTAFGRLDPDGQATLLAVAERFVRH